MALRAVTLRIPPPAFPSAAHLAHVPRTYISSSTMDFDRRRQTGALRYQPIPSSIHLVFHVESTNSYGGRTHVESTIGLHKNLSPKYGATTFDAELDSSTRGAMGVSIPAVPCPAIPALGSDE